MRPLRKSILFLKRIFQLILICALLLGASFFSYKYVFPFVYAIKEPDFTSPISRAYLKDKGLCVRNDKYGEGAFHAKRRGGRKHSGIDIEAPVGTPVIASKSGWVKTFASPRGYGNLVKIYHPGGDETRYAHLNDIEPLGIWVRKGDLIGHVGRTGNADVEGMIPHIHFEIRKKGTPVDPCDYLEIKDMTSSKQ